MNTTTKTDECIDKCNKLLRGERSAVETYNATIEKYGTDPRLSELTTIRDEHMQSVADLEQNIVSMGGTPDASGSIWESLTTCIQKSANLFGKESAVEALQKGEEIGSHDYKEALEDTDEVLPECRELISTTLLPRVERHIATLEQLEERVD